MTTDNQSLGYRLEELERQWAAEQDRTVLLKLAEEYGNHQRWRDAVRVLEEGLAKRPDHVAARVVLGRSHLRSGYSAEACTALEQVVLADPMHLVANKLLVEAYLDTAQVQRARDRLDLYSLLAGSDPDIEHLESEVKAGEQGYRRPAPVPQPEPRSEPQLQPSVQSTGTLGSTEPFAVSGAGAGAGELALDLSSLAPVGRIETPTSQLFGGGQQDPFGDLLRAHPVGVSTASESSTAGTLFALGASGWTLAATAAAAGDSSMGSVESGGSAGSTGFAVEPNPITDIEDGAGISDSADFLSESEQEVPADAPATVTLGHLYLDQGHTARAAEVFIRVLRDEPQNNAAREGLVEARRASGWRLTADDLFDRTAAAEAGSGRRDMLTKYLERIAGSGARSGDVQTK